MGVNKFFRAILYLLLFTLLACEKKNDDVGFFLDNYSGIDDKWLDKLSDQRRVDMFFASHRTRPASYYVDVWIVENDPRLVYDIRRELGARGESIDFDSFLSIVTKLRSQGRLEVDGVAKLNLKPICAKAHSLDGICRDIKKTK